MQRNPADLKQCTLVSPFEAQMTIREPKQKIKVENPIEAGTQTDFCVQISEDDIDNPDMTNEQSGVANEGQKEQLRTMMAEPSHVRHTYLNYSASLTFLPTFTN